VVGVGGVVVRDGKALIVKRAHEPRKGEWSLPGGLLELGESLQDAIRREIKEETTLDVEVGPIIETFDRVHHDDHGRIRYHFVIVDYLCTVRAGVVAHGSDASDVRWVPIADLSSYRVDATVSDVHAGKVQAGMPAVVLINEQPMAGTVATVYPTVENGAVRFTVALDDPARAGLRPSLRVDVHVVTDHKARTVRVTRGPFVDDASRRAFVVRGDRAMRVPLVLGLSGVDQVEIVSGAVEGDELIVSDMRDYLHLDSILLK